MGVAPRTFALLAACAIVTVSGCNRPETLTAEAASERGDQLLRKMSQTLASAKTFSYHTDERRQRVKSGGAKVEEQFSRDVTIRRPNGVMVVNSGQDRDGGAWYDGKSLTFVSNRHKAWARGPMPPTLDEAMDFMSAEYALPLPTADLLYSSPYDALMTKDTTGGWVGVEKVGGTDCDHLAYKQAVVDWEIWLTKDDRVLPCQFKITYKTQPGQPVAQVAFSKWNPSVQVSDDTFKAKIPEGYERLKIMRHATVEDVKASEPATQPDTPAKK
jgi:hypothetical protein